MQRWFYLLTLRTPWLLKTTALGRRIRRNVTGKNQCGHCGQRAWRHRSYTSHGCYAWVCCDRCYSLARDFGSAADPPYFARRKTGRRCATCVDRCGIDARRQHQSW